MQNAEKIDKTFKTTLEVELSKIVNRYSRDALWLKSKEALKEHIKSLNNEIALTCSKSSTSISLKDIERALLQIKEKSKVLGLDGIKYDHIEKYYLKYQKLSPYIDTITYLYTIAQLIFGNPSPILRKLSIKASNKINSAYVAQTYIVGQISIYLYAENLSDEISIVEKIDPIDEFEPIFNIINFEQLKDIIKLLKMKVDINTPTEEIRMAVINELKYQSTNKVKYFYNKALKENTMTYRTVLMSLCDELKINYNSELSTEELEEKMIMLILQETFEKITDKQKEDIKIKLETLDLSELNKELLSSSGILASLIAFKATGFGAYLAASSALGALSQGLGVTFAFSTYTALSSAIATLLGPIGLTTAAAGLLVSISQNDTKKLIPVVLYIAMIRRELSVEPRPKKNQLKYVIIGLTLIFSTCILYFFILNFMGYLKNI